MNKVFKRVIAITLVSMIFACMSIRVFAMSETPMGYFVDAGKSTSEYLDIAYSSEMWDKTAEDKNINLYHYSDNTDYSTYITERDEFEAALEAGKITYVTSISSQKAEVKKNAYNIYGMDLNAFRIYWADEGLSSEGYYLVHIEAGTLISEDGEYGNAEAFVPNQVVKASSGLTPSVSTNFITEIIEGIKEFFNNIIGWFKNLFNF